MKSLLLLETLIIKIQHHHYLISRENISLTLTIRGISAITIITAIISLVIIKATTITINETTVGRVLLKLSSAAKLQVWNLPLTALMKKLKSLLLKSYNVCKVENNEYLT